MSYKVGRNKSGDVLYYGTNDDNYEPYVKSGEVLSIEPNAPVTPQTVIEADQIAQTRSTRNLLLAETDWTQVADAPVSQVAWATYRQLLRDVPSQAEFPTTIAWPTKPE